MVHSGGDQNGGYYLEEDKRATTNAQNGLVFFCLFSLKRPYFQESPGGKYLKKSEKVWEGAKKCEKCRTDFAL